MNVKFKMPKFGRQLTGKGFLKEIGMTTLATTISIVLTFGTAALIEQHQKKQSGRQTAMMVIHDIDENIVQLRDIIRDYLPGDSLCLDASKIDYQPELKDTVQRYLAQMSERLAVVQEQRRDRSLGHRVNACFIDTSGRKIELSRIAEDDDGTNQRVAQYMVRE